MKYVVRDSEAGNVIDEFETKEAAEMAIAKYEAEDKGNGVYKEGFYEVAEGGMTMDEILSVIRNLARSQGLYGRLLNAIEHYDEETFEELRRNWEGMCFKDDVDFIMYIEG